MRVILISLSLLLAACAASPEEAWREGIRLRDANRLVEAREYLLSAARRDNEEAQFEIGLWYLAGDRGLPRNDERAAEWIERAAEHGQPGALTYIWQLYYYGKGVPTNWTRARKWLERGGVHLEGDGVDQSDEDAHYWFERGATDQHPACMLAMGDLYRDGRGVKQDTEQAKAWYKKAASQNEDTEVKAAATHSLEANATSDRAGRG